MTEEESQEAGPGEVSRITGKRAQSQRHHALVATFNEYLEHQRAVLVLADRVDMDAIDGNEARVHEYVKSRYSHLDPSVADKVAEFFITTASKAPQEPGYMEAIQSGLTVVMDAMADEMRERATAHQLLSDMTEAHRRKPADALLYSSLLTSLVANYEAFIGDLVRFVINRQPGVLKSIGKTFTWGDVMAAGGVNQLQTMLADKVVDDLARGPMAEVPKYFREKFSVQIPPLNDEISEIFLRRNIWVHNRGHVSSEYLAKLPGSIDKPEHGAVLEVDKVYLQRSADLLITTAHSLVLRVGTKVLTGDERAQFEAQACNFPYRLLQDQRYLAVQHMCDPSHVELFSRESHKVVTTINYWLALKRQGRFDECRQNVEKWDVSTVGPVYRLARLALLDDEAAALRLVEQIRGTEDLPLVFWYTWPLLSELRERTHTPIPEV
ncbi:hypothetical protein ACH473_10750 [Cellulosimicrobium funkei]|uniref:hypothetical protein n=1 Tax=Cellulosimicrobium funkei TaxID=264251 RepID=UPI0037B0B8FB